MKRKLLMALVLAFAFGIAGVANGALLDVSTVAINSFYDGSGFTRWSHTVTPDFTRPPDTVNWASLTISGFAKNAAGQIVTIEESIDLGALNVIPLGGKAVFQYKMFDLTQFFQAGWNSSNGTFDVTLAYDQPGGRLALGLSTLAINYTNGDPSDGGASPVPEPGTMLLLGTGLVGLAAWGRKKVRK